MKKAVYSALLTLAGLAIVGCSAVNPLEVKQEGRDLQARQDVVERPLPEGRYKIALVSRAVKHASDTSHDQHLADSIESSLATNLSNLGWFETVDRKNGFVLAGEAMISGDSDAFDADNAPAAQFILIAESTVTYVAKQGWKRTAYADKARGVELVTDFRLIDVETKEPLLVKKFVSLIDDTEKNGAAKAITATAEMNAKKFARVLAARYLPEGKVLQTRGDGRYAQISIGKNYQLATEVTRWAWWPYKYLPLCYVKETVLPATDVEFVTIEQDGENYTTLPPFAKGEVLSVDAKYAWVEVENYDMAGVLKNDKVKVAEPVEEAALIQ